MNKQEPIVTLDLEGERRSLAFSAVQRLIYDHRVASNYGAAASIAVQLADQLPGNLWSQFTAAESLYLHQQVGAAFNYAERALAIAPGHAASLVLKSRLHALAGDSARGLRLIEFALARHPTDSRLHGIKAELLVGAGRLGDAEASFAAAIDLDPHNADALLGLVQLPGAKISDELVANVEAMMEPGRMSDDGAIKAHFALAHAYDYRGDAEHHFAHLHAGNGLKSRLLRFDPHQAESEAEGIIGYFSRQLFESRTPPKFESQKIIFIVGFPRCGSTLVEQILSSHPVVSAAGEVYALKHSILEFQQQQGLSPGYPHWVGELTHDGCREISRIYAGRLPHVAGSEYLTDKLLDNYRFIGAIHLIFPRAAIIHVQRDPVDTCYSCYKRLFEHDSLPFTYRLEHLVAHYRLYRRLMRHWDAVLPGRVHHLRYEELVASQPRVTRDLLDYCGLPWDDACLDFHRSARTVQTASQAQVRQPMYSGSVGRWKKYSRYLLPLLELVDE